MAETNGEEKENQPPCVVVKNDFEIYNSFPVDNVTLKQH